MLVGHHFLLLRGFGPCGIIFMNVCFYNRCHGNAVTGLNVKMLIRDTTLHSYYNFDIKSYLRLQYITQQYIL
jgi:hypothetical protein